MGNRRRIAAAAAAGQRRDRVVVDRSQRRRSGRRFRRTLYAAVGGIVLLVPVIGVAFYFAERGENDSVHNIASGLRWSTLALLQDQAPFDAQTAMGTALTYVMLVGDLVLVAMGITAVASKLGEFISGSHMTDKVKHNVENHIVICGWNSKGPEVVRELQADPSLGATAIVVLSPLADPPLDEDSIVFVSGETTSEDDLRRAGIERAKTAIILADDSNPSAPPDDVDARTLLTTLAVESIHRGVYSCVEVLSPRNRKHFERANADEIVVSAEMTGAMLADAAVTHGLSRVVSDLVTNPNGHEFYSYVTPEGLDGATLGEVTAQIKRQHEALVVAIATADAQYDLNPPWDRIVNHGDRLLVIASAPLIN